MMKSSVLYLLICLSGMVFGAEIVASHVTQSLALLISSYHMLYNILSLLLLVISHRMYKGKTLKNTFGWARVKVLGLLVSMLLLAALCFGAAVEAIQTVVHASHEDTEPKLPLLLLVLGSLNFMLNVLCFFLIGGYTHNQGCCMIIQGDDVQINCVLTDPLENENVCSRVGSSEPQDGPVRRLDEHRLLDLSRDVSSCLTVVACGAVIMLMDGLILKYADAILSVASLTVLLSTTYPFLRESGLILLQSIPNHIDVNGLTKRLVSEFPDVLNVHDLHVWRLTTSGVIATVHIILSSPEAYPRIDAKLKDFFYAEGISSVTIQPEFTNGCEAKMKSGCILKCSENNNCGALTCCGPIRDDSRECLSSIKVHHRCAHHSETLPEKESSPDLPLLPQYDFAKLATALETTL